MATEALTKFCQVCLGTQEAYEFKNGRGGSYFRCKVCHNKASNRWRDEHPEARKATCAKSDAKRKANGSHKNSYLQMRYKISLQDYNDLLVKQNFSCAICKRHQSELTVALAVDHNHLTNRVRGLLCYNCNSVLGYAKDSQQILEASINYLGEK